MCPLEPELKGNLDPTAEIETLNEFQFVEIQAPAFRRGSTRQTHLPQARMHDPRSAQGHCPRFLRKRSVLQDVRASNFGPFGTGYGVRRSPRHVLRWTQPVHRIKVRVPQAELWGIAAGPAHFTVRLPHPPSDRRIR